MEKAQNARAEAILNKAFRYNEGVMTRRQWLKYWQVKGAFTQTGTKPKTEFNRDKYNRMNGDEQVIYERKCAETTTGYYLQLPGTTEYYEITKTEYDHFNALRLEEDINTQKYDLQERIAAGIATEDEINDDAQRDVDFCAKYFKNK